MSRALLLATAATLALVGPGLTTPALAAPQVVTDIAPVQSLVARVMDGVGNPAVLLPPGASPHHYALKPSDSQALDAAGVVFWVGPELEPWLEKPIAALAGKARVVALFDSAGTEHLPARTGATFDAHDHGDEDGHDHADHDHDHEGHDHAHEGEDHAHDAADHDHDHGGDDPHAWLDPQNARAWLGTIAATLAEADPDNAAAYRANAEAGAAELTALEAELTAQLKPVAGTPFIVFHDAYQYFEHRFGFSAAGSISLSEGVPPGPARLAEVQQKARDLKIACAFREPQFDPALIDTVFEGQPVKSGVLDPLGAGLQPGPGLYPDLLRDLAAALVACKG